MSHDRRDAWRFGAVMLLAAVLPFVDCAILFAVVRRDEHTPLPDPALVRTCDREVGLLLTSQALVEVQRAGILVRALGCDVVHRMSTPTH